MCIHTRYKEILINGRHSVNAQKKCILLHSETY